MTEITPNSGGEIVLGTSKILKGHTDSVNSVYVKDNLIISGSYDSTIRITPITLFPNESHKFQSVINKYSLPRHLEEEIIDW